MRHLFGVAPGSGGVPASELDRWRLSMLSIYIAVVPRQKQRMNRARQEVESRHGGFVRLDVTIVQEIGDFASIGTEPDALRLRRGHLKEFGATVL